MTVLTIVFAVVSSIGGLSGVAALANVLIQRRGIAAQTKKTDIDADVALAGGALEWLRVTREEATEAKDEAKSCRAELAALKDHVDYLERMMKDGGLEPPPFRWPLYQIGGDSA